jgi:hypothetical protein
MSNAAILPSGTLATITVVSAGNADAMGRNLLAAYAVAKLLTPGGQPLSATNRAAVVIPPGTYKIPKISAAVVADPDADTLTGLVLANGTPVIVGAVEVGNQPGGTSKDADYYVVNASGSTFQIALCPGGAAVDITSAGTDAMIHCHGLVLDADYVDLAGLGSPQDCVMTSDAATTDGDPATSTLGATCYQKTQTCRDVRISGISFQSRVVSGVGQNTISCPCFQLASGRLSSGTGATFAEVAGLEDGEYRYRLRLPLGTTAAVGDWVEMSAAEIAFRRSWKVLTKTTTTYVNLYLDVRDTGEDSALGQVTTPAASAAVTWIVRAVASSSLYDRCRFSRTGVIDLSRNSAPFMSKGHITGTWTDCVGEDNSYRVGAYCHLMGTWSNCVGGGTSFAGDGNPGGIPGSDTSIYSHIGPNTTMTRCKSGYGGFAGCSAFGGYILSTARLVDCEAGDTSYATGRTCNGTFIRCIGGYGSFGGYAGRRSSEDQAAATLGQFVGYAEDCSAWGDSFGTGYGVAGSAVEGQMAACTGVVMGRRFGIGYTASAPSTTAVRLLNLGLADNACYRIKFTAIARRTDAGTENAIITREYLVQIASGTVTATQIGAGTAQRTTLTTADATLAVDGTEAKTVTISVTGEADKTVKWTLADLQMVNG